jgi:hypothetical protein
MATLPRYQNLGVQYADLPKISTAAQQAQAVGYDALSRSLDRMSSYLRSEAETEAKKQAKKYAVENPLTNEQVQQAMADPSALKVKGAGSIFQETYQAYATSQLSADLQLKASQELRGIEQKFINNEIDVDSATQLIKDLMDGQSAMMSAISPEVSIQHRAAAATLAKTTYNKILDLKQKEIESMYKAEYSVALEDLPARLESVIRQNASAVDSNGNRINIEALLDLEIKPFLGATRVFTDGSGSDIVKAAYKIKNEAKVGAVTGLMQDRNFAPNSIEALKRMRKGDYGDLTPVYNGLDQASKDKIRTSIIKGFADEESLRNINEKELKAANKAKANTLNIELLRSDTPAKRQRQIVYELLGMDEMTVEQADKHLNGEEGKGDVNLFLQLNDQISRGAINSLGGLTKFKDRLSSTEYKTLGTSLTSTQGNKALKMINLEAGIRESAFSITEDQKSKQKRLLEFYEEELTKKTKNENGVEVYAAPTVAAQVAIKRYADAKIDEKRAKAKTRAATQIEDAFNTKSMKNRGITLPNLPIDEIDFGSIKGLTSDEVALYRKMRDEALKGK